MNAPAAPSFVCEHGRQRTKCPDCEVIALERELAAMTAERAAAIASWDEERERAQREGMRVVAAEAENVALKKLVAKCKPAMELVLRDAVSLKLEGMAGVYQAMLTEIDAALKGKK